MEHKDRFLSYLKVHIMSIKYLSRVEIEGEIKWLLFGWY